MDEVEPEPKPGKYPSLDDILRDEPEPQFLLPCTICNKTFNPESLQRHSKICEKNATRKRKQFDSFKQRVQGTGIAEFLSLAPVKKEKPPSPRKLVNSWKEKHEAFVSAIRAARGSDSSNDTAVPNASGDGRTPVRHSDHEQCPFCGRSFGPKAFDRHIEWCREQRQRQPPTAASLQARERLEARIKYRAPPCKSKRSLMREKYSPLAQRKNREQSPSSPSLMSSSLSSMPLSSKTKSLSAGSQKTQPPEPPVRYNRTLSSSTNRTQLKENSSNQGLNRGGISRTSIRASQRASQRSVSPKKPISPASTKTSKTSPYRPSSRASDRRSDESLNLLLSSTEAPAFNRNPSNTSLSTKRKSQSIEKSAVQPPPQIISKTDIDRSRRNSAQSVVSESPKSEVYDPYQSAERQMFELFNSDSAADLSVVAENLKNVEKRAPSSSPSISPSHSPVPCPPLETSPTSAFTRYSKENEKGDRTPSPAPAPPPRQHRSVSVELPLLTEPPRPPLLSHHSVDAPLEALVEAPFTAKRNSDERPRTYDIYSKEERRLSPISPVRDSPPDILVVVDTPVVSPPISPPPEFVELREIPVSKAKESRESREIREITSRDHSPLSQKLLELSDEISIDNLMEEVARMQQYVSLMSSTSQPRSKQSAKSRRSRANKLHIEDYLYPADSPMRGTTPIMGDVCNPVVDLNVGSDNEDNDVVVSPNALAAALKSEIRPRGDLSPVLSKDLASFFPDSSRSVRHPVDALAVSDARRRLPGDSDEDEVRSARNSPVPRTASNRQSTGSRLSGDSAYSSLNRKSPIPSAKGTAPLRPSRQIRNTSPPSLLSQSFQAESMNQSRDLSSSSSETSLHALSTSLTSRKSIESDAASKLSKFCHECGTKFPVSTAKFCPECGIRRLGM